MEIYSEEQQKPDSRIIMTEKKIRKALLKLMKEKPYQSITPTELCREAKVNRNTFYSHYKNIGELVSNLENEIILKLREPISQVFIAGSTEKALMRIFRILRKNPDYCEFVFSEYGDTMLLEHITTDMHDLTTELWKMKGFGEINDDFELLFNYITKGCISSIKYWRNTGMKIPPENVAKFIEKVVVANLHLFFPKATSMFK